MNLSKISNRYWQFIIVVMGFFMPLLDTTIVNITIPKMMEYFSTDTQSITWVLNGYNLAFAVLLITASRLADQFGRKKVFLIGVLIFIVGSFFSGLSVNLGMLILFRVIQGIAAAFVVPVSIPIAVELFPPSKRGVVMGLWGAFAALASAGGPSLGGILTEHFEWQSIFYINIPIGIIVLIFGSFMLRESYDPKSTKKIDWAGILTLSVSMFTLTLALIQSNDKGWLSFYIISLFAIASASFAIFLLVEKRSKEPMLPLQMMKIKPFMAGSITFLFFGIGIMGGLFLLSLFFIEIMGMSELRAGLVISIIALVAMIFAPLAGFLSDRIGSRYLVFGGMLIIALSMYLFNGFTPTTSLIEIFWKLTIAGAGIGITMSPLVSATTRNVPPDKVGMSSGITNMTRTLGTVFGIALLVAFLTFRMTPQVSAAKREVIDLIQNDKIFSEQLKSDMVKQINDPGFSIQNFPTLSDIIAQMNSAEQKKLEGEPPLLQFVTKASFNKQENEMKKLWPHLVDIFKDHAISAFSDTFDFLCFLMIVGSIFGIFSDVPKKRIFHQV